MDCRVPEPERSGTEPGSSRRLAQITTAGSARLPRTPEWRAIAASVARHYSATGVAVHFQKPTPGRSTRNEPDWRSSCLAHAKCDPPAAECSAADAFGAEPLPAHIAPADRRER